VGLDAPFKTLQRRETYIRRLIPLRRKSGEASPAIVAPERQMRSRMIDPDRPNVHVLRAIAADDRCRECESTKRY
jgi:hypothetical protein